MQVSKLKAVGRVVSVVFLLVATMGPWWADTHQATEETCPPPFVWLGCGCCARLVSLIAYMGEVISGLNLLRLLWLLPALPIISTLFLLLIGERKWMWLCHLAAWGLFAAYSLCFLFLLEGLLLVDWLYTTLVFWGAGLGGLVAVAILTWETLMAKLQFLLGDVQESSSKSRIKPLNLLQFVLLFSCTAIAAVVMLAMMGPVIGGFCEIVIYHSSWVVEAYAWLDENGDGLRQGSEKPLGNVQFYVDDVANGYERVKGGVSSSEGRARFGNSLAGCSVTRFEVYAIPPSGYCITTDMRVVVPKRGVPHGFGFARCSPLLSSLQSSLISLDSFVRTRFSRWVLIVGCLVILVLEYAVFLWLRGRIGDGQNK